MTGTKSDVLTFGETMLRLSPPGHRRLAQTNLLETWVAGSESNLAAALRALGHSVTWVSRLPDNALGRRIEADLRSHGIDTTWIVWAAPEERVGLLYTESSVAPRPAQVLYDRADSAASRMTPGDLADALFARHRHLHLTGITPALSAGCADTALHAVRRAREYGCTVSFDVNYRAKLWTEETARKALAPLMAGVDVLFCSRNDAARLFAETGRDASRAEGLRRRFGARVVAVTAGEDGAVGCRATETVSVPAVPLEMTVDRFGSGDAFAAGFLSGFLGGAGLDRSLRLGVAAAALKRTVAGDMLSATGAEIESVLAAEPGMNWR